MIKSQLSTSLSNKIIKENQARIFTKLKSKISINLSMHFLVAKKIVRDIKISIANNHILTNLSMTQGKQEQ